MLILSRRPTEVLRIGNQITVTVLAIKGNQVRIGVQAPREIVVDREEVWQRKRQEAALGPSRAPSADRASRVGNGSVPE